MQRSIVTSFVCFLLVAASTHASTAVSKARALAARGADVKAMELLRTEIKEEPSDSRLRSELGQILLRKGDLAAAKSEVDAALKSSPDDAQSRWILAEIHRERGELDKAQSAYRWHFAMYNRREIDDADQLYWVARGIGQYVRWRRLHDAYSTLVNEVYPQVLKLDPKAWRARLAMGHLFMEKYNLAEADRQFVAGIKINPDAAELHAARAKLFLLTYDLDNAQSSLKAAREINPNLLAVHQLTADLHFANFRPKLAIEALEEALKLRPHDEATLGRFAAAYVAIDGTKISRAPSRLEKLKANVHERSARPGSFYAHVGAALDQLRRYPAAATYWRRAIEVMPQHPQARGQLGMIEMRLGQETQARKTLGKAFEDDPFNVRVKNTLAVLEVLEKYETIETPHFLIRFDPVHDRVLARAAAEYLEYEVFEPVTKQLGYVPKEKTLIEIFSKAKNTSGHGWFSARMVGLPSIGTVGACAGKVVAIASPNEMPQKFNWAQVLKHEFVHVVNLQQTDFNIPHWFTEALAVHNEGYPRSPAWNRLLADALANDKLFDLNTINYGFVRPESSDAWSLAYCQAELYAEFMLAEFGDDALAKLLAGYTDRLETDEAVSRAFEIDVEEFERRYMVHLRKTVAALPKTMSAESRTFVELRKAVMRDPDDVDLAAEMALALARRRSYPDARRWADKVIAKKPEHQLAAYVRARLHLVVGESEEALKLLEKRLDRDDPQANALALLAGLKLKGEKYEEAAALYELGAAKMPGDIKWPKSLAVVYLRSNDNDRLADVLKQIAGREPDNFGVRKKLAEIYESKSDHAKMLRWATAAIHANANDAASHRMRAAAQSALGQEQRAINSYENVLLLDPKDAEAKRFLSERPRP
ncbi:MAG: tetratricopeptide repeat protein [Pirellulales bacterium]|nr:tetratricopeptide repeat protein [Pirellulales bacterium]